MSEEFFLPADIKGTPKANIQKFISVFEVPFGLSLTMLELVLWYVELYFLWGRSLSAGNTHKFVDFSAGRLVYNTRRQVPFV